MQDFLKRYKEMTPEERLASVDVVGIDFRNGAMYIRWSGAMGFGEYCIQHNALKVESTPYGEEEVLEYELVGYSEQMDSQESKHFIKHLFTKIAEQLIIES